MWSANSRFVRMTSHSTAHCHLSPCNNDILAAGIAAPVTEVVLFLYWNIEIWLALAAHMMMLNEAQPFHYGIGFDHYSRWMRSFNGFINGSLLSSAVMRVWMWPRIAAVHGRSMARQPYGREKASSRATATTLTQADRRPLEC